jgi:hypothetical protein
MSKHEKTARIIAIDAPQIKKKAFESFKETRQMMITMIKDITDITAIVCTFLSSIKTSFF